MIAESQIYRNVAERAKLIVDEILPRVAYIAGDIRRARIVLAYAIANNPDRTCRSPGNPLNANKKRHC